MTGKAGVPSELEEWGSGDFHRVKKGRHFRQRPRLGKGVAVWEGGSSACVCVGGSFPGVTVAGKEAGATQRELESE